MVKREVTGAPYGVRDWLAQRVTAVVMAVSTFLFLAALAGMPSFAYPQWKALWGGSLIRVATMLFFLSLFVHAWVGMRNIFMDYVKPTGLRLMLHAVVILTLVGYAVWSVRILWSV